MHFIHVLRQQNYYLYLSSDEQNSPSQAVKTL